MNRSFAWPSKRLPMLIILAFAPTMNDLSLYADLFANEWGTTLSEVNLL